MIDTQRTQLYHLIDPIDSVILDMPRERGREGERKREEKGTSRPKWLSCNGKWKAGKCLEAVIIAGRALNGYRNETMVSSWFVDWFLSPFQQRSQISKEGLKNQGKKKKRIRK